MFKLVSSVREVTSSGKKTRMHSSRIRTVRCSGCRGACLPGGVSAQGLSAQVCLPRGCIPTCTGWEVCIPTCTGHKLDAHLWKHYLSATTLQTVTILYFHSDVCGCLENSVSHSEVQLVSKYVVRSKLSLSSVTANAFSIIDLVGSNCRKIFPRRSKQILSVFINICIVL